MNYNFLEIKKKLKKYIQKGNTIYIESDIFELLKYSKVKNIKISKTLLVIRYENGLFKNSKPCKECIEKLRCNVKKIIY